MNGIPFFAATFPRRFPENIRHLFSLTTKAAVTKYAQKLVLDSNDLVCAILYAELGGYAHFRGHDEWQPQDAQLTQDDMDIVRKEKTGAELGKFVGKLNNLFRTRKHLSAHFFIKPGRWHLFYFTFDDMTERKPNHWKHGRHLHFINDLWPQYKLEQMEARLFGQRKTLIEGSFHIRVSSSKPRYDA
ncbi:MAG: hypothetical protein ABSH34_18310 [Verrucomicrobiota bacterium]|jgi:hypothetical protein